MYDLKTLGFELSDTISLDEIPHSIKDSNRIGIYLYADLNDNTKIFFEQVAKQPLQQAYDEGDSDDTDFSDVKGITIAIEIEKTDLNIESMTISPTVVIEGEMYDINLIDTDIPLTDIIMVTERDETITNLLKDVALFYALLEMGHLDQFTGIDARPMNRTELASCFYNTASQMPDDIREMFDAEYIFK